MTRIEQLIEEIQDYVDSCKYQTFSTTNIVVNKEEMEEFITELKMRVPDEVKKYQKIVGQQDAILQDARAQAQNMISDARNQIDVLVSDQEVMQEAYRKANEIVESARQQAEAILRNAEDSASAMQQGAVQYTDGLLAGVQDLVAKALEENERNYRENSETFKMIFNTLRSNRSELGGQNPENGQV